MQIDAGTVAERQESPIQRGSAAGQSAPLATDPACLEETSQLLEEHALATPEELNQLRTHGRAPLRGPRPWDPLEFLAALRVREPDQRPEEMERLGRALCQAMGQPLALIPFASRLPTPSAFYDVNKGLLDDCRRLMVPILYAEEAEVIGVGSINPVALRLSALHVTRTLGERTGTQPIVSRMLLHHDGWISLCQKQFGI